jgi:hypothetical protein
MTELRIPGPLSLSNFGNLSVVPHVRGRLMFAQAAAHAIGTLMPDCVAVDLPLFLDKSEFLDTALSVFPLVTAMLVQLPGGEVQSLPFVVSDAACLSAHLAQKRGILSACIDDGINAGREAPPDDVPLPDDCCIPNIGFQNYFQAAWQRLGSGKVRSLSCRQPAHASGVTHRLLRLLDMRKRVLFVCEWKRWHSVEQGLAHPDFPPIRRGSRTPAALVFEDPLQCFHRGYMDDFPALNMSLFEHVRAGTVRNFDKLAKLSNILDRQGCTMTLPRDRTPKTASEVLEQTEANDGHEVSSRIACELLAYPLPSVSDAGDRLPVYGTITPAQHIGGPSTEFELLDVGHARPYYPVGRAEHGSFYPAEELDARQFWGPGGKPLITRKQANPPRSTYTRWSIPPNFTFYAHLSHLLRESVRRANLDPPLIDELDEFTPVVFQFSGESDGDIRPVEDANATKRKQQQGLEWNKEQEPPPDSIFTFLATRKQVTTIREPHAQCDDATSIALLHSGPEAPGPERYDAVTRRLRPEQLCRSMPGEDTVLRHFPPQQACAAWAVQWAPEHTVLIAAYCGWEPSEALADLAKQKGVRMVLLPISVIPRELITRLRRRVFVSETMRFHPEEGERFMTRLAQWRI